MSAKTSAHQLELSLSEPTGHVAFVEEAVAAAAHAPAAVVPAMRALTPEQEQAVSRRHGSLLLSAGAGSGKTSVLVERFVRAVLEDGIAPARILAITFTERSAGELAERIRTRFLELGRREAARDTEAAFLGTFHGFAARLLRAHPLPAGLDPDFAILDEAHAGRLRLDAFRGALADFLHRRGAAAVDLLAAFTADRLRATVFDVHAQLRSQGHAQPALPLPRDVGESNRAGAHACGLIDVLLRGFAERYAAAKSRRGVLDFDDLELFAAALLREHSHLRSAWSQRFELLMVDEFQDTNPRQLAILAALEHDNLFTVGDELQSIYGFRHADVELFRARRSELARRGAALALSHNFRGTPALLAATNAVFATRFGEDHMPLLPGRGEEGGGEASIELLLTDQRSWNGGSRDIDIAGQLPPAPRWRHAEARLLAQRLADIVAAKEAQPGDIAVLLRAAGDLPLYQRALEERGLPTLASVGSFWGHQQVGDLLAYLRALANPLDEVALYCTLASPLVGLSSDALAHISLVARAHEEQGVWDTLRGAPPELQQCLPAGEWQRLTGFTHLLLAERSQVALRPIAELARRALRLTGYEQHLLALPFGPRRLANVHKLLRLAQRFEAQEGRDLRGFLDHIDHQLEVLEQAEPEAPVADGHDAVRLMTIHAAKGLEFPLVALADLGRRPAANRSEMLIDGPRIGLRLAQLDGSPAVPTLAYEELLAERRLAEAREEQRIVYVALTRARRRLVLSGALDFAAWPADVAGAPPLAWLAPALHRDLPALAVELSQTLPVPAVELSQTLPVPAVELPHTLSAPAVELPEPLPAPAAESPQPLRELQIDGAPHVRLRTLFNTPSTLGAVLRPESLHPNAAPPQQRIPPSSSSAQIDRRPRPTPDRPRRSPSKNEPPLALSYTALSELERCGYRYYLERILGLAPRHAEGSGGRARGRILHRLLQDLDFARPRVSEEDVARAAAELGVSLSARQRQGIAGLLHGLAPTALARRLAAAPRLHREHPFAFSSPVPVNGVFDLLLPGEDCLVVDYKSDAVEPSDDLAALVYEQYSAQRLVYALAALHHGAARVEIVHWFLARPHEPVSTSFGAGDLAGLGEELKARAAAVGERGFAVSLTPHRELCLTCPGRGTLCSWDDAATMRAHAPASPQPT
jgi:ATP-dependent helicase/nuclease subunit A